MASADHARRPKGLAKTGGRRPGSTNKRTAALRAELIAAGASDLETQPFRFLSAVMNDEGNELPVRVDAAKALIPYTNFRKGLVDTSGRDIPITIQIIRFSDGEPLEPPRPVLDMGKAIEIDAAEGNRRGGG
jgi:hypothetical protein